MPLRPVRVLASVRVPSSHGPDVDYEIVHVMVRAATGETREAVVLRLNVGDAPRDDLPPEILLEDLPAVHAQWTRFVTDVLCRRAEAGDRDAQAALEKVRRQGPPPAAGPPPAETPFIIAASGGRFGARDKAASASVSPGPRKSAAPSAPPAPPAEEPRKPRVPDDCQVIGFNLSTPPTADGILRALQAQPESLVVVAPMAVAKKAEDFIRDLKSGAAWGNPTSFSPLVVRRGSSRNPVAVKKLRAELAGAIARMLGDPNSALWILPE